jgi:hypothetical protein
MIGASIALLFALAAQEGTDSVVARAKDAIAPFTDSAVLHKEGYYAIGFGAGTRDLTPFQGQHWISLPQFFTNKPVDLSKPMFMMYLPMGDSLVPIGVAYVQRIARELPLPTTLGGTPAEWHSHVFCSNVPGEGRTLADGAEDCKTRGGTPAQNQLAMVHTWTIANPDGPYAHDNPSLPFIATGLTPPAHAMKEDRLFGIALGETYGAKLVTAHRIDRDARVAGTRPQLESRRAVLRALVPQLREAERAGDRKKFADLREKTIDAWNALAETYRTLAMTPEIKARFDVDLEQALGTMSHHHM